MVEPAEVIGIQEVEAAMLPPNPYYKPPIVQERIVLDEGPVDIAYPQEFGRESYDEFAYWIDGILRRARRRAGVADDDENQLDEARAKR